MKYKVGDKVKLINNDTEKLWRNKTVTISAVNDLSKFYRIEEDDCGCWYEDEIECLVSSADATHPSHYQGCVEPIDLIEAQGLSFGRGNVVKYVCRAGRKGSELEDLKKAEYYLKREMERLERGKEGGTNDR